MDTYKGKFWNSSDAKDAIAIIDPKNKYALGLLLYWKSRYNSFKKYFSKKDLLDVGVGTGTSIIMFEKYGFNVVGIEPDQRNVSLINKSLEKGKCFTGYLNDMVFHKKFDIIWVSHVLEHIQDSVKFLKKCNELLNDDGVLCIIVPDCGNPEVKKASQTNPFHIHHFSPNELISMLEQNGFDIIECTSVTLISMTNTSLSMRRFHKVLRKLGFTIISEKFCPLYPYFIASENNGDEIRIIVKKNKQNDRNLKST